MTALNIEYSLNADDCVNVAALYLKANPLWRMYLFFLFTLPLLSIGGMLTAVNIHAAIYWWCLTFAIIIRLLFRINSGLITHTFARMLHKPVLHRPTLWPLLYGPCSLSVDDAYITKTGQASSYLIQWLNVARVVANKKGILLAVFGWGGTEIIYAPRRAFMRQEDFDAFESYCRSRMALSLNDDRTDKTDAASTAAIFAAEFQLTLNDIRMGSIHGTPSLWKGMTFLVGIAVLIVLGMLPLGWHVIGWTVLVTGLGMAILHLLTVAFAAPLARILLAFRFRDPRKTRALLGMMKVLITPQLISIRSPFGKRDIGWLRVAGIRHSAVGLWFMDALRPQRHIVYIPARAFLGMAAIEQLAQECRSISRFSSVNSEITLNIDSVQAAQVLQPPAGRDVAQASKRVIGRLTIAVLLLFLFLGICCAGLAVYVCIELAMQMRPSMAHPPPTTIPNIKGIHP